MRIKKPWMLLRQQEIEDLDQNDWEHYNNNGCLCAAHSDSECACGAWLVKERG